MPARVFADLENPFTGIVFAGLENPFTGIVFAEIENLFTGIEILILFRFGLIPLLVLPFCICFDLLKNRTVEQGADISGSGNTQQHKERKDRFKKPDDQRHCYCCHSHGNRAGK